MHNHCIGHNLVLIVVKELFNHTLDIFFSCPFLNQNLFCQERRKVLKGQENQKNTSRMPFSHSKYSKNLSHSKKRCLKVKKFNYNAVMAVMVAMAVVVLTTKR